MSESRMQTTLEQLLAELRTLISQMVQDTSELVSDAVDALRHRDVQLAKEVIDRDQQIDQQDTQVDELVAKILALQQPVASDLRAVIGTLKISGELERVSDHAVNIAESAIALAVKEELPISNEVLYMAAVAELMLASAVESFMDANTIIARGVLSSDDEVDDLNRNITRQLTDTMTEQPSRIEAGMELIRVCKNLERIADHATNIAEDVIYINDAKLVKHTGR
ncbi:MAG: phosphate signaling complex protein PhoU [Rhizobacter sp.]|nr:phosphate signaling complex protein PhoU [Chlorobiales bacterium]